MTDKDSTDSQVFEEKCFRTSVKFARKHDETASESDTDIGLIWAADRIAHYQKELAEKDAEIRMQAKKLSVYEGIVADSDGVAGFHLNDDVATWSELLDNTVVNGGA